MVGYNFTLIGNSTGLYSLVSHVNTELVQGQLGNMFLLIIFTIALISFFLSTAQFGKSFLGASFLTFLLAIPLVVLGLCQVMVIYALLIAVAASAAFSFKD